MSKKGWEGQTAYIRILQTVIRYFVLPTQLISLEMVSSQNIFGGSPHPRPKVADLDSADWQRHAVSKNICVCGLMQPPPPPGYFISIDFLVYSFNC
jgi:hypothetical protein